MNHLFGVAMPTRIGKAVGKGLERVMLQSVGGGAGIRKSYVRNPDGSTTTLATRGGMPVFRTPQVSANPLVIEVSSGSGGGYGGAHIDLFITHVITLSRSFTASKRYSFFLLDVTARHGIDYISPLTNSDFSGGVTISGGNITVPAGVTSFSATVTLIYNPPPTDLTYEIHVRSSVGFGNIGIV